MALAISGRSAMMSATTDRWGGAGETRAVGEIIVEPLQSDGLRHEAVARRVDIAGSALEARAAEPREMGIEFVGLHGRIELSSIRQELDSWRVRVRVENSSAVDEHELAGIDRASALQRSFISTH